jgi:mono/diheme cytochrome c family protein
MLKSPAKRTVLSAALFALAVASAGTAHAQQAQVLNDGKREYDENCVPCHGQSGMGEGKMANLLSVKPPDLTRIAKRAGGEFPFWEVYADIDGEKPIRAHELSPMPLWGARFRADEEVHGGPAFLRILSLTHYLESIQEK